MATLDTSALEEYTRNGAPDKRRISNEKFLALSQYRTFCAEAGCRVNSAVVRFLESVPSDKPLTEIPFQNFYLGPKGFVPVLELILVNQTVEVIDVRGNGLDNASIQALCASLEKHLGVRSLYVGSNPISVEGGKHIMVLLEHNRRITAIDVSETNVYESMSLRMDMQVAANREAELAGVTLVPSKPSATRGGSATTGHTTITTIRNAKPEITILDKASMEETPRRGAQGAGKASPQKRRLSPHKGAVTSGNAVDDVSNTQAGAPKPRPPPPALVSREASRWTEKQRQDMLQKYQERSKMYHQVVRSDASRAADRAREELMKIEQGSVVEGHHKRADTARRGKDDRATPGLTITEDTAAEVRPTISTPTKSTYASRKSVHNDADHGALDAPPTARWSVSELPAVDDDDDDDDETTARGRRTTLVTDGQRTVLEEPVLDDEDDKAARLVLHPITLSRDEQFKELFTKGCQQYNDKQLDAAYLTWNEAMDLAVTNKNREWMSVISNNLQRLSYEILVAEGANHLDNLRLEDADKAFQFAADVAHKAKNAQWEGEMHRARKNVQHAVFQRSHEAALRLFEKVQNTKEQRPVTNDDRFTLPGDPPGKLREYSSEFVGEWTRMLLVKEALEMWADAMMMSRRVSGSSGKVLGEVVTAAVDSVCTYLARKYLVPEPNGNILSLQRTSHFACHEGIRLIELWTDLVSKTQTALSNRTWDAIGASVLGNLYLSTHQLPQALHQFEKIVDIGSDKHDALLLGLGNTYLGVLHWQRSNNAVAEKCFLTAMEHWRKLRASFGIHRHVVEEQQEGLGHSASPSYDEHGALTTTATTAVAIRNDDVDASPNTSSLSNSISIEYLNAMLGKCFTFLIRILFSTSRYRDALEMLERGLLHRYKDRLHDKMLRNFTAKPTMDHITAVAASLDSPLVYYETSYRFDWSIHAEAYEVSQQLMVWVVVKEGEMKVVRVDVTNDFGVASIDVLLEQVQNALHVTPIPDRGVQDHIITKLPEKTWREPLAKLYEIMFHPVADFIASHDAQQNQRGGVITVIPSSSVWMVPFNGLIMRNGQFLVEAYTVQHAFCSVQIAFSTLSARRAKDRDLRKKVVFVHPSDASHSEMQLNRIVNDNHVPFPIDIIRSYKEGQRVVDALAPPQPAAGHKRSRHHAEAHASSSSSGEPPAVHEPGTAAGDVELVDDVHTLRELLPKARILHIAATNAAKVDNDDGTAGALIVPASQDELALLRTSEVSTYEMMSELVVLPHTNIASDRIRTTREGTLSLCRAFLSAGAASVIFSRWCTPDLLPIELFEPFYQLIQQKKDVSKAKALTTVLRKLLSDDKFRYNPRLWCGFLMVGVGNL